MDGIGLSITDPDKLGDVLRLFDHYHASLVVRCALRLTPLLLVRPGELRKAKRADIDLDTGEWRFVVTKTKTDLIVPLARQSLAILRELYAKTGTGKFVFPSERGPHREMSDGAVLVAMRSLGIAKEETCAHGFRATARTMMDEILGVRPDFIEAQLGHGVLDPNGRAYNRTKFLAERHRMMQDWADYLDKLKAQVDGLKGG